jgi:DNA primase
MVWSPGQPYHGRVILPIVVQRRTVDFVARLFIDAPKFVPKALSGKKDDGAQKELSLWGYDDLDPGLPTVHVTEGLWGAQRLRRLFSNVTAACGSGWSRERSNLLKPWSRIVLWPDGDDAGRAMPLVASALRYQAEVLVVDLPDGAQPDTIDDVDARALFHRARPPTYFNLPQVRISEWKGKQ